MRCRPWFVLVMVWSPFSMTGAGCTAASDEHTAAQGNDVGSSPEAHSHEDAQTAATTTVTAPSSSNPVASAPSAMPMAANPPPPDGAASKPESPASVPMVETAPSSPPPKQVTELSDQVLATWGSSVCDGYSVASRAAWPWTLEEKLAQIKGPKVSHMSTSGHTTDSKESAIERAKVADANFVVVCLSLGN